MEDLLLLVADKNMQALATALLKKFAEVERISPIRHRCLVHQHHDPGVLREGVAFLRPLQNLYRYGILLLDHEGCGRETASRTDLESELERDLATSGWADRSAAIIIAPELEQWVWLGENHVAQSIDWPAANGSLHQWLEAKSLKEPTSPKPFPPKEALHAAMRHVRLPPSSAIIADIITRGSYRRCQDAAFLKLLSHLRQWFL